MPMHNPPHPGEVVREFMAGRTVKDVAAHIGVSRVMLSNVVNGKASVSAEMSLRLAKAFRTSPELFLKMQNQRDLWVAARKKLKVKPLPPLKAA